MKSEATVAQLVGSRTVNPDVVGSSPTRCVIMKLPSQIKIGAYIVKVQFVENLMTDDGTCGNYNNRTQVISLDPVLEGAFLYGVFLHEVVEAIKSIYHIECLKTDHHAIDQLGEALNQLLRDNGSFILYNDPKLERDLIK